MKQRVKDRARKQKILRDSLTSTRRNMISSYNEYTAGEITENEFRTRIYGLKSIAEVQRNFKLYEIEIQLNELETKIGKGWKV